MGENEHLEVRLDLSDSAAVGVVDLASDGTIVAANAAFAELVGAPNPVGRSLGQVLDAGSKALGLAVSSLLDSGAPGGEPIDATIVLPDGERRQIELRSVARRGESGERSGVTVTVMDRSARSEAQAEAERLRAIFEDIADLIGIMAPDGTVLSMNPSAVAFFGSESRDRGLRQFVPPWRIDTLYDEIMPALSEQGRWEGEVELLRHDGVTVPHHVTLRRHPSEIPDEDYWWAVARDQSVARRAAEAEALASLNHSKDRFIAGVSHELRTPLTTIRGFADILTTRSIDEPELSEFLAIIRREAHSMSSIVEDLLVAARVDAGQVGVVISEVDLWRVVNEVVSGIPGPDRRIEISVAPGLMARGDPMRCRQIVRNLMVNTLRHGGPRTWVESEERNGDVLVHVCDDGSGIEPELSETIFEPYVSRPNDGRRPESVGLGLTVCRQLARLMDGDVVYSHPGHTRFTLRLPRIAEPDA